MTVQEAIKLIAAFSAFLCIGFGILALFRGLKAEGEVDLSGLIKGKVRTGSAGVLLLFFGTVIFATLIIKGHKTVTEETKPDGSEHREESVIGQANINKTMVNARLASRAAKPARKPLGVNA